MRLAKAEDNINAKKAFMSKALFPHHLLLYTFEKELLAIIHALHNGVIIFQIDI